LAIWIYPEYSLSNFLQGVKNYEQFSFYGDVGGEAYQSSFCKSIKLIFIILKMAAPIKKVILFNYFLFIVFFILFLYLNFIKSVTKTENLFLLSVLTTVFIPFLPNFYLLIYFIPIFSFYLEEEDASLNDCKESFFPAIASLIIIAPKCYATYKNFIDYQSIINPIIILLLYINIFRMKMRRHTCR
jgi:hypothetical protein